jgi:hypothetical protein
MIVGVALRGHPISGGTTNFRRNAMATKGVATE